MIFNKGVAAMAAFVALAEAIPTSTSSNLEGFTVAQQATGKRKLRSGPLAMEATYKKFGKPVPANIAAAAAAAVQSGSVTATPTQYDEEYICPVQFGSSAKTLNMDFDTGSSDLWVFCSAQPASQTSGHTVYTPGSSARLESGETWNIAYGDGSGAKGIIYADQVTIGGVTATSQAVECATSVSSEFISDTSSNGLVGFAFDSINTASPSKVQTFMGNVAPSLPSPIFTAYLKHAAAGSYDFGFINTSKYTGTLAYTNVNTANGFWEFTATGYTVGSTFHSSSLDSIADTGTTLIYLPNAVINAYYGQVRGAENSNAAGGVIFPCSSTLPNLGVTIGGVSHTVPGSYINFAPYSGSYCFGGLQSSSGIGFNILGDVFLKSQYVVFDLSVPRIGFAQQA